MTGSVSYWPARRQGRRHLAGMQPHFAVLLLLLPAAAAAGVQGPGRAAAENTAALQQLPTVTGLNASSLVAVRGMISAGTLPPALQPALASLISRANTALHFPGHGSGGYGCPERGCATVPSPLLPFIHLPRPASGTWLTLTLLLHLLLRHRPWSVTNKPTTPPSGDKHDFTYISTYAWPCNAECNQTAFGVAHCKDWWRRPHGENGSAPFPDWSKCDNRTGMPWIGHDGFGQRQGQHDSDCSVLMSDTVETLSTAYFLTANETYAEGAAAVFRAWFITPATAMNPNLMFGGYTPGANHGLGKPSGIIVTTCRWTTKVTDAAALLAGSAHWTAQDRSVFDAWNRAYLEWLLSSSPIALGEFNSTNNHFTWLEVETLALAVSTGNASVASMLAARARSKHYRGCLQNQIDPHGVMKIEATREAGASYSTMNLHALFTLATVMSHVSSSGGGGVDQWAWQDADGRGSIQAALDYLLPFATNQKPWPWKQDGSNTPWTKFPWTSLAPQLRIATIVYGDQKYEAAIAKLNWKTAGQFDEDVTQLLWPLPSTLLRAKTDDQAQR